MEGSRIDFLKEEERLRSILLRILIGIFIALASFLFSLALPFYPTSFAIVLALAVGALAYRSPTLSLAVMFFINMPGYLYQGGFHVAIVVVAGLVFFAATFTCLYRTGACLPVAAGVIAAGLMFTPLYFMSIPLLITVILFRARGIGTGSPLAALVFLAIYTPFLARGADLDTASQVVPLFQQVNFQPQPPIFTVELAVIFDKLRAAPGTDVDLAKFLGIYYLFVRNTDLSAAFTTTQPVGRLLGLVLYFIMIFSIFVAFITHSLYRWLEAQELGTRYHLEWIGPTLSLVIADVAFLVP
ncbi:MAG: hypothetical protein U1D67_07760, partial [Dehalococcoidia bacterium]|nr:hypothetical protein [Dehalococcoidia bacterium]